MDLIASGGIVRTDGWTLDTDTWVYVSASSFKVAGKDVTSKFPPGTKIAWTQTTQKYGYVASSAFSTDTTVTIVVTPDYTIANATITAAMYSYAAEPVGHPIWMNYSETWTGFSTPPSGGVSRFKIEGRQVSFNLQRGVAGTSNNATHTITLPIKATALSDYYSIGLGIGLQGSTWDISMSIVESGASVSTLCFGTSTSWATSGDSRWVGVITYEI